MEQTAKNKRFRVGILGGMGPLAGVRLQQLIIEATPATRDQEHLEVVCFTNPHIPDRTESLACNNGSAYLASLISSARILESTGVTTIVIPCNTAHARLESLQKNISIPVLDMISLALESIAASCQGRARIGLLATDGTLRERVYENLGDKHGFSFVLPNSADQQRLMTTIYDIKGGKKNGVRNTIMGIASRLVSRGADAMLFGCTELSLYAKHNMFSMLSVPLIDPLRVVAHKLVALAQE